MASTTPLSYQYMGLYSISMDHHHWSILCDTNIYCFLTMTRYKHLYYKHNKRYTLLMNSTHYPPTREKTMDTIFETVLVSVTAISPPLHY